MHCMPESGPERKSRVDGRVPNQDVMLQVHEGSQRGPPQAQLTWVDSPSPLRLLCERCVGATQARKDPTRFPLCIVGKVYHCTWAY